MDEYLWEHIQIFLDRDDLLCLRETSQFNGSCEVYGLGWTVILSSLVHVPGTSFDYVSRAALVAPSLDDTFAAERRPAVPVVEGTPPSITP